MNPILASIAGLPAIAGLLAAVTNQPDIANAGLVANGAILWWLSSRMARVEAILMRRK